MNHEGRFAAWSGVWFRSKSDRMMIASTVRWVLGATVIVMVGLGANLGQAGQLGPQPQEPNHEIDVNKAVQLQNCREGILDPSARDAERRRWVELLFTFDWSEARALRVNLLEQSNVPAAQRVVCEVITHRARQLDESPDPHFITPLMALLGVPDEGLRIAAAQAIAEYTDASVLQELGAVAASSEEPMPRRLAAIEALARQIDRREAVAVLMKLLDVADGEIPTAALAALRPASRRDLGANPDAWRDWWIEKSALSGDAWLNDRLEMYRDRLAESEQSAVTIQEEARRRGEALTSRLGEFQREIYRTLQGEQRDPTLTTWLGDPLAEVKLTALSMIQARIADEGGRPSGTLLSALLRQLKDSSAVVRRQTLLIVQTLGEPGVVQAVLEQLESEVDTGTRQAILRALGKLGHPESVPALIAELTDDGREANCIQEAALALGRIADRITDPAVREQVAEALKVQHERTRNQDGGLRSALLTAMAGLGDQRFRAEFLEGIESDDTAMVRAAIRGLRSIQERGKLSRLRTLAGSNDAVVRLEATDAIGALGQEDADLEVLLTRVNPKIETNDTVRNAAWRGFLAFTSSKTPGDRVAYSGRLREIPDREEEYLAGLLESLVAQGEPAELTDTVFDRYCAILTGQSRLLEATECYRRWFESSGRRGAPPMTDVGLHWVRTALRTGIDAEIVTAIQQVTEATAEAGRADVIVTILGWVESDELAKHPERVVSLLGILQTIPSGHLGDEWRTMMTNLEQRVKGSSGPAPEGSE